MWTSRSVTPAPSRYRGGGLKWLDRTFVVVCALLPLLFAGCSSDPDADQRPASQPAEDTHASTTKTKPVINPFFDESQTWTKEQAAAALTEKETRLSAVVRLIRLSECLPPWAPEPLPLNVAASWRIAKLADSLWAAGLETGNEKYLAAPVLIDAAGEVRRPLDDATDLFVTLHLSNEVDFFPHLAFYPGQMLMFDGEQWTPALAVTRPADLRFELRFEHDYPYIALLWRTPADENGVRETVEAGRYDWDPYEFAFSGPLCDKLPHPPGGQYELDLDASPALIPVGGVIPEPPKFDEQKFAPDANWPTPY